MIKYIITGIVAISTMVIGAEISNVSPSSAELGTSNITVTFKLGSENETKQTTDEKSSRGGGRQGGQRGPGGQGGPRGDSSSSSNKSGSGEKPAGMLPPTNLLPNSVKIGSISGTSIAHTSSDTVTAVFSIPYSASIGTNEVVITFTDPMGQPDVYSSDGFEIINR